MSYYIIYIILHLYVYYIIYVTCVYIIYSKILKKWGFTFIVKFSLSMSQCSMRYCLWVLLKNKVQFVREQHNHAAYFLNSLQSMHMIHYLKMMLTEAAH